MNTRKIIEIPTQFAINTNIINNLRVLREKLDKNLDYIDKDIQEAKKEKNPYNPKSLKIGFDGTGVTVISHESKRNLDFENWYGYIIVKTKYVKEITWLLFKLKRICALQISDYGARKDFFKSLAIIANGEICKDSKIRVILFEMINHAEAFVIAPF